MLRARQVMASSSASLPLGSTACASVGVMISPGFGGLPEPSLDAFSSSVSALLSAASAFSSCAAAARSALPPSPAAPAHPTSAHSASPLKVAAGRMALDPAGSGARERAVKSREAP
jgi:hypothetical protein